MSQHELPDDLYHVVNELTASGAVPRSYLSDQVYMHTTLKAHLSLAWDVQKLKAAQARWLETSQVPKPERRALVDLADWHRRYVEAKKTEIDSGYAMSLPYGRARFPVLLGRIPDPDEAGSYEWVMDGSHRLYRAWKMGERGFPAVKLTLAECEACRLSDQQAAVLFGGGAYQEPRDIGKGRP